VDLGEGVAVSRVVIYNRNDGDASHVSHVSARLSHSVVSLINYQGNTLKTYSIGDATNVPVFDIIFATPNSYLGCYAENQNSNRILPYKAGEPNPNGAIQCAALCKAAGYKLAGTQYSYQCWCGDSLNGAQPIPDNECNMQCLGNAAEMCGGSYRNSVYTTGLTASPTYSPTTSQPTASPTTASPTASPTYSPTTFKPTASPTTASPTASPTYSPTTSKPTASPTTASPTASPTYSPTTSKPTSSPTSIPTASPSKNAALVHKVRVQLLGANHLNMREVQVFDTSGVNRALNKPATQSSTSDEASKAVNGNLNDNSDTNYDAGMYHEWTKSNLTVTASCHSKRLTLSLTLVLY
jgi:hypothetical protein